MKTEEIFEENEEVIKKYVFKFLNTAPSLSKCNEQVGDVLEQEYREIKSFHGISDKEAIKKVFLKQCYYSSIDKDSTLYIVTGTEEELKKAKSPFDTVKWLIVSDLPTDHKTRVYFIQCHVPETCTLIITIHSHAFEQLAKRMDRDSRHIKYDNSNYPTRTEMIMELIISTNGFTENIVCGFEDRYSSSWNIFTEFGLFLGSLTRTNMEGLKYPILFLFLKTFVSNKMLFDSQKNMEKFPFMHMIEIYSRDMSEVGDLFKESIHHDNVMLQVKERLQKDSDSYHKAI